MDRKAQNILPYVYFKGIYQSENFQIAWNWCLRCVVHSSALGIGYMFCIIGAVNLRQLTGKRGSTSSEHKQYMIPTPSGWVWQCQLLAFDLPLAYWIFSPHALLVWTWARWLATSILMFSCSLHAFMEWRLPLHMLANCMTTFIHPLQIGEYSYGIISSPRQSVLEISSENSTTVCPSTCLSQHSGSSQQAVFRAEFV